MPEFPYSDTPLSLAGWRVLSWQQPALFGTLALMPVARTVVSTLLAVAYATLAPAATRTWTGGSSLNNKWSSAANWGGTAPSAGDVLIFAGTTRTSPNNDLAANTSFSGITFAAGASSFTLSGNAIQLSGPVTNLASNAQTIGLALAATLSTCTVNTAAGDISIGGVISGSCILRKLGAAKLTLSGNNSYSVGTLLSEGTLSISKENLSTHNLGALTASCCLILAGGSLEVTGGALYGSGQNWMLRNILLSNGGGTVISPVELGHENYSSAGETITGGTAANGLTLKGGDITLRPGGQNTLGKLTVFSGRTFLRNDAGNGYPVNGSDQISVNANALLVLTDHMPRSLACPLSFASDAGLCTRTHADYSGAMTLSTATVTFPSAGRMIFNNDDQATESITINGNYPTLTGDLVIQVGSNNATIGSVTFNGAFSGAQALGKSSGGTLILNSASSHSGGTTVNGGLLDVRADGGLGSGPVTVASGASLKLGSGVAHNYIGDQAPLLLDTTALLNLAFVGTDVVAGLSFDGGATYQANGTWGSATSGATHRDSRFQGTGCLNVVVATATAIDSSANPSTYATPPAFTATVTSANGIPGGQIQFRTNNVNFGTPVTLTGGTANSAALPANGAAGSYTVTAIYLPSGSYHSSTGLLSGGQTVQPLPVTLNGTRPYDGTTDAGAAILAIGNAYAGDDVTVASGSGTLAGALAGWQTLTGIGTLMLGGPASANYTLSGATGSVLVTAGPASRCRLETSADGSGTDLDAPAVRTGTAVTAYTICRDAGGNFVSNAPATWGLTCLSGALKASDLIAAPDGYSATFTAHAPGAGILQALAGAFMATSGVLTVPYESGRLRLPPFEEMTLGTTQPAYPIQSWWVNGTGNDQYARWSADPTSGVGRTACAMAQPGPNATGGSSSYVQALRLYYFPVLPDTDYHLAFAYKATGPGFVLPSGASGSELQIQVLESPHAEGGAWLSTAGPTLRAAPVWTPALYAFTTKPTTRCVCLKFGMLFGDGNRAIPLDRFYLDDDRGTMVTLASTRNPAQQAEPFSFTATVSAVVPGMGTPSGSLIFKTNGIAWGAPATLAGGEATTPGVSGWGSGIIPVSADYSGDTNYTSSAGDLEGGQRVILLQGSLLMVR